MNDNKHPVYAGEPHGINQMWKELPHNFTHVDAVYENKYGKIIFFIGKHIFFPSVFFSQNEIKLMEFKWKDETVAFEK